MENNQQQILSEIKSLMNSVRLQLEELDAKIAQWQQCVEPEEIDMTSVIDLELEDEMFVQEDMPSEDMPDFEEPVEESVDELADEPVDESVDEPVTEPVDEPMEEPVAEPEVEDVAQDVEETEVEEPDVEEVDVEEPEAEDVEDDDDLPFFDVPEEPVVAKAAPVNQVADKPVEKTAVIDMMTRKHAWRTAMPGAPVKDIRGAIALMDRVLFINTLFGTDPMAFQETLTQLNQMQSLDQAVEYLALAHPEWDFDSDVVYSFMMAVRRKVNA